MLSFLIQVKFDWSMLFGFLAGIFAGVSITFLFYLLVVLTNLKNKTKIVKATADLSPKEMVKRIDLTKEAFKEKKLKGQKNIEYALGLCKNLAIDTASAFFPDSNHPLLELSVDEIMLLSTYINKRVDEVLDNKALKMLKKVKLSTIMNMTDVKRRVDENSIIKATKKYKLMSAFKATRKVINLINPLWWARKLVIDGAMNIIINKICLIVIGIVGEETYKIYSKKVFDVDSEIDSGTELILKELDNDLKEEGLDEEYQENNS